MPRQPRRICLPHLLAAAVLALGMGFFASRMQLDWPAVKFASAAESGNRTFGPRQNSPATPPHSPAQRQREGTTLVDVPGHFRVTGDRATFFPAGSELHYIGLENLNLERIAAAVTDIPDQIPWMVSGTITEYRGANYLLVTKAIMKNAPANPNRSASSSEPAGPVRLGQGY